MNHQYTDALIIGAGPVGLFAAFACAMHGLKVHIVDSMPIAGGQCAAFYPDKTIYDIPGYVGINGQQFIDHLLAQVTSMSIDITLNTQIQNITALNPQYSPSLKNLQKAQEYSTHIDKKQKIIYNARDNSNTEYNLVATSNNNQFHAKYMILATGAGGFEHNKLIAKQVGLTEERMSLLEQTNICYTLPKNLTHKTILILGGGDTALDYALMSAQHAKHVYIAHRRATFSGLTHTFKQLQTLANVTFLTETILQTICTIPTSMLQVYLQKHNTEALSLLVDYIIPCYGFKYTHTSTLNEQIQTSHGKIIVNPDTYQTHMTNVYCIGDANYYPNKSKLFSIARGFGEVASLF